MAQSQNPIAVRSRAMIAQALFALLREKPYDEITVSELAARAQIARKTFYRNFSGKDEVLAGHLRTLCEAFIARFREAPPATYYEFALIVFGFWQPHAPLLRFLHAHGLFAYFERAFDRLLPVAGSFFPCEALPDPALEHYTVEYVTGGFRQLLCAWLLSGAKEPPARMAAYFDGLRRGTTP